MSNKHTRNMDMGSDQSTIDAHLKNPEFVQAFSMGQEDTSTRGKVVLGLLAATVLAGVSVFHDSVAPSTSPTPSFNTDQNQMNDSPGAIDQIYTNHEGVHSIEIPQIPGSSDGTTPHLGTSEQIKAEELPNGSIQE